MDVCKEFMVLIRKVYYRDVYLILVADIMPQITEYIHLVNEAKFEDGSYHTYYGEVKRIISTFFNYWGCVIDEIIQEADRCSNIIGREELLTIMDRTIDVHQARQVAFGKNFLPVRSPHEKQVYEEMEELYNQQMDKFIELKEKIEKLNKPEKVDDFVKEHFKITVARTAELFEETRTFLSMMLADRVNRIRVSLEEIVQRVRNNLRDIRTESEEALAELLHQLYDKNKELLGISRQYRKCSIDFAEADYGIDRIRSKIQKYSFDPPLSRLEDELAFWETRVEDFQKTASRLYELKKEQEDVAKQEQIYNSLKTSELPGSKKQCWMNMGVNFAERRKYLKEKIIQAGRELTTFLCVRGTDRILYHDEVGRYYVDEFNHQVYVFNYGLNVYHRTCEGNFKEYTDKHKYYFDKFGRYITDESGGRVYQSDTCTSEYALAASALLHKRTRDCGHSERINERCFMHSNIKDGLCVGEILPDVEPVQTKNTLPPDAVRYLWQSLGAVLPLALHDVGRSRTKNPIQQLAHSLIYHKYNKTKTELRELSNASEEYRDNIFKERKEKAMAASRAWKAKQVPRRKPEESDDIDARAAQFALDSARAATLDYCRDLCD